MRRVAGQLRLEGHRQIVGLEVAACLGECRKLRQLRRGPPHIRAVATYHQPPPASRGEARRRPQRRAAMRRRAAAALRRVRVDARRDARRHASDSDAPAMRRRASPGRSVRPSTRAGRPGDLRRSGSALPDPYASALRDDALELRGRVWRESRERQRIAREDGRRHGRRARIVERAPAAHHLVEQHAHAEQIAAAIGRRRRAPVRATCRARCPMRRPVRSTATRVCV